MTQSLGNRRPIRVRNTAMARTAAETLARAGVTADQISLASLVFAVLAAGALLLAPSLGSLFYLLAAILVPLRLAANLLDGMVAVENRKGSALGPLFNEWPDRVADVVILASAGYAAGLVPGQGGTGSVAVFFGWLSAVLAVLTSYVREFGRAEGAAADFGGPFAKQQRMWAVIAGALVAFLLPRWAGVVLALTLFVIASGTAYTLYLRTMRLARFMRATDASEAEAWRAPDVATDPAEIADQEPAPASESAAAPRPRPRTDAGAEVPEAARPQPRRREEAHTSAQEVNQPRPRRREEPRESAQEANQPQPRSRQEPQASAQEANQRPPRPRGEPEASVLEAPRPQSRLRAERQGSMREAGRQQPRPRAAGEAPAREAPRPQPRARTEPQAPAPEANRPQPRPRTAEQAPSQEALRPQPRFSTEPQRPGNGTDRPQPRLRTEPQAPARETDRQQPRPRVEPSAPVREASGARPEPRVEPREAPYRTNDSEGDGRTSSPRET